MNHYKGLGLTILFAASCSVSAVAQKGFVDLLDHQRTSMKYSTDTAINNLWETSYFVEGVSVNLSALNRDSAGFNFNLGKVSLPVYQTHSYDMTDGYLSWNGTIDLPRSDMPNELDTDVVNFVIKGDRVFGQIRMLDKIYEVSTLASGRHILAERDFSKIGYEDDSPKNDSWALAEKDVQLRGGSSVVRVMQIASNSAISAAGGVGPIVDRMNFFISQANQAYSATGIPITMESAGLYRATNNERSTAQQNASGLRNLNDGFNDSLANGTRNSRSADLVGMIVATPGDPGICGIVNSIGGGANNGFFVVKYSCTDFTFVHEVGHLFGARHQNDPTTTPYAYGHGIADSAGNFRSIMGTTSTGLPRLGGFSNPDFTVGGRPFGTASFRDNDRVHRVRAGTVSSFR